MRTRCIRTLTFATLDTHPRGLSLAAPNAPGDDFIDEVLGFFKANVLFKSFELKGPGDRTLIYLTLYITQCLGKLEKCPTPVEGMKALTALAHDQFRIPGDVGFALGSFFPAPASGQEGELFRSYFKQLREELGRRLLAKVYDSEGKPSKFWLVFAKKKFMNKARRPPDAPSGPLARCVRDAVTHPPTPRLRTGAHVRDELLDV